MNKIKSNTICIVSRRWTWATAVLLCTLFLPHLDADEKIVVEREAELQLVDGEDIYSVDIELGQLPVGKTIAMKVTLNNPFDTEVKFSGVSNKCACKQFKSYNSLIPAKGKTVAEFTFKTPGRHRSVDVDTSISLVEKGAPVAKINMSYELKGLLAFTEMLGVVRFDSTEQSKRITVPFIYSAPIEFENVTAKVTGKLEKATIEIVKTETGGLLTVTIPEEVIAKGNARGEVFISYPGTTQMDCYFLSAKDARVNEISPKVLRFRYKNGFWQANAIVKIAGLVKQVAPEEKTDGDSNSVAVEESQPIQCTLFDEDLKLDVKPLKNNTFRVQLVATDKQIERMHAALDSSETAKGMLVWKINNGRKTEVSKTEFRVGLE